ncbi:MAG: glycosyltransferase family 4 protein [Proteobacteria bacterium]|nr:glycosyltransferase family 4 protein [Pseudomonadota bacterium]
MSRSRTHILYIAEFSTGGSVESLLCLVGGLDKATFKATVLFFSLPGETTCARFEAAGATVCSLYPRHSDKGDPKHLPKHQLQSKIRAALGRRIEQFYASLKYALHFLRFRLPVFNAIRRQIGRIQPDLIHLNNGVHSDTPGILAARTHHIPTICHIRTFGKLTYVSVVAARSVRVFLCISDAVREHLTGYGIESSRCVVVPNCVDQRRFNEADVSAAGIREEFGWDSAEKVFALVGRIVSWKGQDFFIQAIAEARKTDASIRGLIVGDVDSAFTDDAYAARLRALVSEFALDDIVRFTGHRSDIPNIMKSADAVICASSLPEPFGRVIIESMAVGTPAVATNAGGATDIITDGVNGILVPISDSEALAKAMLRLSRDTDFAQKLRSAAMQTVADRYTVRRHVAKICTIYRSVLGSRKE